MSEYYDWTPGETVRIKEGVQDPIQEEVVGGAEYCIENLWEKVSGKSWMISYGNPAAMQYGMRSGLNNLPVDDNVLYGKIGPFGHLVHVSEIEGISSE